MPLITEKSHYKKLKDYNINIKTKYIVGKKILERNTDNSVNDDIENGIKNEKLYFLNNKLVHRELMFDTRIEYTFISKERENKKYKCPNCGMESIIKDFIDGCPYCRTVYNVDYQDKDLGGKYHYDRVLKNPTYRIITAIVDVIVSLILSYGFIVVTSRTFNSYDFAKVFIYGFILAAILYYFFYIIDGYIIYTPIKNYKDKQNQRQIEFWKRTKIDKKVFYNNLNYEIRKKYYGESNIIDYDVLDYLEFRDYTRNNLLYVDVKLDVRIIYYENGKLKSKYLVDTITLYRHEKGVLELDKDNNLIKCPKCGSSVDATKTHCSYCHTEFNYLQEWIAK